MKKFFALILTLAMVMAMSTTAFAAEGSGTVTTDGGTQNIDVSAKYQTGATTPDVVSVDVAWGAMEFTYSVGGEHKWNPADHTYIDNTSASWSASGNTVTVTNHSNVDVKVGFAFAPVTGSNVTGSFAYNKTATENVVTLTKGVEGKYAEADSVVATLTLAGEVPAEQTSFTKVGTITVTINK